MIIQISLSIPSNINITLIMINIIITLKEDLDFFVFLSYRF